MKILLAVVALSFVICSDADMAISAFERAKEFLKCFENVDTEEYIRWSDKDIKPADVSAETRCAVKCVLETYNVIDEDTGELLLDDFNNKLDPEIISDYEWINMVEACQNFKSGTTCDKAIMTLACFDLYTDFVRLT